ncbi:3-hydroxyacyl-CoA dehydrogenase family protein [Alcaligenes endophyticus]|uniref:3-hydroxyacyl-CoA dehydrogenase NAD-binding domain-containing protein n=1 Tax=Alcaligenes endophyticus TaxID=1929088 RepID=A0ABT8EFA0_9BURK|nr:3-hydroxyacyl-CoA dehydrogenase NAD-binding domain-containing protein [Alcaligenes endophyticus]MCX5590380.1 3-hydroxyacyl-CoA dehydrogenase NAD-binding domain-containing protein [Alcaligenes endophyticus]MDN4119956.1 3-hydroxyacyl-CoA dehydrogenase NAD-binding domain-containing protein [Alcaligenes endophyticus]
MKPTAFHAPAHFFRPSRSHAVVVGGGTMGAGVAVVLCRAGCKVTVLETQSERAALVPGLVQEFLEQQEAAGQLHLLQVKQSLADVPWSEVDVVIECIPERLDIKQALFAQLEKYARPDTLLASNSSSFPISDIARGLNSAERMIGLHFFMPAHLIPLVEVVCGQATARDAADNLHAFMYQCGMVPVLVKKDLPGFLANRLQHALAREAFSMIDAGIASPEDVDAAVRYGFGFRFLAAGPVLQREHAGLEVHCAAGAMIYPSLASNTEPSACLADKVAAGHFGLKTGQGFYTWTDEEVAQERKRYQSALLDGLNIIKADLPVIADAAYAEERGNE